MYNDLKKLVRYIILNLHGGEPVVISTLTGIIFLCDAEKRNAGALQSFTNLPWYMSQYGPFLGFFNDRVVEPNNIILNTEPSYYGGDKTVVSYTAGENDDLNYDDDDLQILKRILDQTRDAKYVDLQHMIAESPAVRNSIEGGQVNLGAEQ